jgi:hypothetical protein
LEVLGWRANVNVCRLGYVFSSLEEHGIHRVDIVLTISMLLSVMGLLVLVLLVLVLLVLVLLARKHV